MAEDDNGGSLEEHDIEALRLTHEEARTVIDHQINSVRSADDKAARTFRLDAILIGLVLTAVSFLARSNNFDVGLFINILSIVGIGLLILSFISAILAYTITDMHTGIGESDIRRLVDSKYSEKEWVILLIRSEAAWMETNEKRQRWNNRYLNASHTLLILATLTLVGGVVLPLSPF